MSGTSADAIDVAIVHIPEKGEPELRLFREHTIPAELRKSLLRLAEPGQDEVDILGRLDRALGETIADAVLETLKDGGIAPSQITVIGSHGQTVRHRPHGQHPFTLQIGCPSTIAERTGITTVADFRRRDMAAGGEGAPLAPFAHRLLFGNGREAVAVLNIGGIANVSFLPPDGKAIGFDTGPGNMIMDSLMLHLSNGRQAFDRDGQMAASGAVCQPLLAELLQHPFFPRQPPKSTGREDFGQKITDRLLTWPDIDKADRIATALELTARSIVDSLSFLPEIPRAWHVCGGGACNTHLMQRLKALLAPATVQSTEAIGVPPAAVEAMCFALLARHTLQGAANTLPEVTGAHHAVCGGHIVPGDNWPTLLKDITA